MDPRRPLSLLAVLAALLFLLFVGIWLGGHPRDLPGFLRGAFVQNHETLVVNEAINRIAHDYYRPIPKEQLSNSSVAGAVAGLHDRFSHYLSPSEFRGFNEPASFTGIGVEVNPTPERAGLRIARVFDSSPAARAGLKAGDLIVAVNGQPLKGLPSQRDTTLIKGPPNTTVRLEVQRSVGRRTTTLQISATRATISEPVVASATRTIKGVKLGVLRLATFSVGAHGELSDALQHELRGGARGIVLDLRANGGGLVEEARLIASLFLPKGAVIVSTRGRTQPAQTLRAAGDPIAGAIPVVVLVDGGTASASEIVTAALQDHHRATVLGTHTFGKGVFQEEEPLSNGGALDITVGEYFTPNGRNLGGGGVKQGAGIDPEVAVPPREVDTPRGLEIALQTLAAKAK
ncbi:MAG TPA: S41 family peptidase [Solirubrobacteraceae bacterium]|jgi:carboxyl-terminal processing protease|nr:S41 family peptidase [Solirubrobacteraceae bacterium]